MGTSRSLLHFLLRFWPAGRLLNGLARREPFSRWLEPLFSGEQNHAVMIPIHQVIRGTESVVLPEILLGPLVTMASDRVIVTECLCRRAENCTTYPHEIGCLFLGRGAARIHPSFGKRVTETEAMEHIQRAIHLGLTPLIVHTTFDAYVLGIPYTQMLGICFCCDCCCTVRSSLRKGPPAFWDTVERLPGLHVAVTEDCTGCEVCLDACCVDAIQMVGGVARIGERCKGCGRCVELCPVGAIQIDVSDVVKMSAELADGIQRRTTVFSPLPPTE